MKKLFAFGLVMILLATMLAACGATPTPEVIIQTVEVEKEVTVVETVEVRVEVEAGEKTVVEFWSTDKEEDRVDLYEEIAARFMAENPDIDVRIVPIDEAEVTQRIAIPDLVIYSG